MATIRSATSALKIVSIALAGAALAGRRRASETVERDDARPARVHEPARAARAGRRAARTWSRSACAARRAARAAARHGELVAVLDLRYGAAGAAAVPPLPSDVVAPVRRRRRAGDAVDVADVRVRRPHVVPVVPDVEGDPRPASWSPSPSNPATVEVAGPLRRSRRDRGDHRAGLGGAHATVTDTVIDRRPDSPVRLRDRGRHRHGRDRPSAGERTVPAVQVECDARRAVCARASASLSVVLRGTPRTRAAVAADLRRLRRRRRARRRYNPAGERSDRRRRRGSDASSRPMSTGVIR